MLHDVVRDFLRESLRADGMARLHRTLLDAAAAGLPAPISGRAKAPWWELPDSAHYLWEHLVEHLLAADGTTVAAALATDLRWVTARLERSGPAGPIADLSTVETPQTAALRRLLGQIAHLLAPTQPPHSRADILFSRIQHDTIWGSQVQAVTETRTLPALRAVWPVPDPPDPALRRVLAGRNAEIVELLIAPDDTWLASTGDDGSIRIWNPVTGDAEAMMRVEQPAYTCAWSPRGHRLIVGGARGMYQFTFTH